MAVTGSRREARERALGLCYELEVRDLDVVPLFVETGERVKVDTRTGEYLTRA